MSTPAESNRVSTSPEALVRLHAELSRDPGVILFTALQWSADNRTLRRVYSSHPREYPVGAEKSVEVSTGWLSAVIVDRRPFLAATAAGVAEVFSDIALIRSLGCGSVINLPVTSPAGVLGVLALLHREGHYTDASVEVAVRAVAAQSDEIAATLATAPRSLRDSEERHDH